MSGSLGWREIRPYALCNVRFGVPCARWDALARVVGDGSGGGGWEKEGGEGGRETLENVLYHISFVS